jgi:hypothetical protein
MLFYLHPGDVEWTTVFAFLFFLIFMIIFTFGLPALLLYKSFKKSKIKNFEKEDD